MQILTDIKHIFFPNICLACENVLTANEKYICTFCIYNLPLTNYTKTNENAILKTFYGRINISNATALLFYKKKGIVQELIHNLKYRNHQDIGSYFGDWLGKEMAESKNYATIDYVIPVPLHRKRLRQRGYNQVSKFGQSIATQIDSTYNEEILIKKNATKTQSKKGRLERILNQDKLFLLTDANLFKDKHILLVDDIITTGATIEACCAQLYKIKGIKISIAVIAITE